MTTKLFYTRNHPDGEGVKPAIEARRTARDAALGRDPGLDAVRRHLA